MKELFFEVADFLVLRLFFMQMPKTFVWRGSVPSVAVVVRIGNATPF